MWALSIILHSCTFIQNNLWMTTKKILSDLKILSIHVYIYIFWDVNKNKHSVHITFKKKHGARSWFLLNPPQQNSTWVPWIWSGQQFGFIAQISSVGRTGKFDIPQRNVKIWIPWIPEKFNNFLWNHIKKSLYFVVCMYGFVTWSLWKHMIFFSISKFMFTNVCSGHGKEPSFLISGRWRIVIINMLQQQKPTYHSTN